MAACGGAAPGRGTLAPSATFFACSHSSRLITSTRLTARQPEGKAQGVKAATFCEVQAPVRTEGVQRGSKAEEGRPKRPGRGEGEAPGDVCLRERPWASRQCSRTSQPGWAGGSGSPFLWPRSAGTRTARQTGRHPLPHHVTETGRDLDGTQHRRAAGQTCSLHTPCRKGAEQ